MSVRSHSELPGVKRPISLKRRNYKNPPIFEAYCEFYFGPGSHWDPTAPGRLFEALRNWYPATPKEPGQLPDRMKGLADTEVVYFSDDEKQFVSVGPTVLRIHVMEPYPGWEEFELGIRRAYEAFRSVLAPTSVESVGVRYLNRISLPAPEFVLSDYFRNIPKITKRLPRRLRQFYTQFLIEYDDDPSIVLFITFANLETKDHKASFLLDLEVAKNLCEQEFSLDETLKCVADLRNRERDAFEAFITEKSREVFNV